MSLLSDIPAKRTVPWCDAATSLMTAKVVLVTGIDRGVVPRRRRSGRRGEPVALLYRAETGLTGTALGGGTVAWTWAA